MKWLIILTFAVCFALIPVPAAADSGQDENVLVRVGADVHLPLEERVGTLVVIDGDVVIDGEVAKALVVINGNVRVSGDVSGQLTVISGDIDLQPSAHVKDITSIRGEIFRSEDATVTGEINENDGSGWLTAGAAFLSIAFWVGITVALVCAAIIFAAVGGRQLQEAAIRMTAEPVGSIVGAVFFVVAIPIIAGLAIATLVGIPFGIGLILFLLPALWFLGYIVAGCRLGRALLPRRGADSDHPYAVAVLGVILLQLAVLIPILGVVIAVVAGIWGSGSLVYSAYRSAGGRGFETRMNRMAGPPSTGPAG